MNYELAKELKDAGFPQREGVELLALRDNMRVAKFTGYTGYGCGFLYEDEHGNNTVYAPTLSELIEACGDEIREIENTRDGWRAYRRSDGEFFWASSIEEAVARLWLALKSK